MTEAVNRGQIYKFLTKPWDDDELRKKVETAFERYEQSANMGAGGGWAGGGIPS